MSRQISQRQKTSGVVPFSVSLSILWDFQYDIHLGTNSLRILFFPFYCFSLMVSLCSLGCVQTHYAAQGDLKLAVILLPQPSECKDYQ